MDDKDVAQQLGRLAGSVESLEKGLQSRLDDIRDQIKRLEIAQNSRMDRIEASLGTRIDGLEARVGKNIDSLGQRVTALENEDKRLIAATAKLAAVGGVASAVMVAVAVELAKRLL